MEYYSKLIDKNKNDDEINSCQKNIEYKISFIFKGKYYTNKYKGNEKINSIFNQFSKIINFNIDQLHFKYDKKIINNYELTLNQLLFNSNNNENIEIVIEVIEKLENIHLYKFKEEEIYSINDVDNDNDNEYDSKIIFNYYQNEYIIECKENDNLQNILNNFSHIINKGLDTIYFLCNGEMIKDYDITINQIVKFYEIDTKEIFILVENLDDSFLINPVKTNEEIQIPINQNNISYNGDKMKKNDINEGDCCNDCYFCCIGCIDCCKDCCNDYFCNSEFDLERSTSKLFLIAFITKFFQYITIEFFFWYGYNSEWHKIFITSGFSIFLTIFCLIIVSSIIFRYTILLIVKEYVSKDKILLFFSNLLYIPIIVLSLFILSNYFEIGYLLCVISIMITVNLAFILSIIFCGIKFKFCANIIFVLCFCSFHLIGFYNVKLDDIIYVDILCMIIYNTYIYCCFTFLKNVSDSHHIDTDEYGFLVLVFNYIKLFPVAYCFCANYGV